MVTASRPDKLNHADTVLYEMYMMRHTAGRLFRNANRDDVEEWICLESFLTHFRNLISFLAARSTAGSTRADDDIHIENLWEVGKLVGPEKAEITAIRDEGRRLYDEYEGKGKPDKISRYLHHCTQERVNAKRWEYARMANDIEILLARIEPFLIKLRSELLTPVAVRPVVFPHTNTMDAANTLSIGSPAGFYFDDYREYVRPAKKADDD